MSHSTPMVPMLPIPDLQRLARVLGVSIGKGYADAVLAAEADNAIPIPPTKEQQAFLAVAAELPAWAVKARQQPRAQGSPEAKLLDAVLHWMQVVADEEEAEGQAPEGGASRG